MVLVRRKRKENGRKGKGKREIKTKEQEKEKVKPSIRRHPQKWKIARFKEEFKDFPFFFFYFLGLTVLCLEMEDLCFTKHFVFKVQKASEHCCSLKCNHLILPFFLQNFKLLHTGPIKCTVFVCHILFLLLIQSRQDIVYTLPGENIYF